MVLASPYRDGARVKVISATITYAAQASGSTLTIGDIPQGAVIESVRLTTSASTGTATLAVGIAGDTTKYKSASTVTTVNRPQLYGDAETIMTPTTALETIIITTGTAALPASGTLQAVVTYLVD